jgi:DNA-binding response OmpR family regulator
MALMPSPASGISPTQPIDVLLVDAAPETAQYAATLRGSYRVATTASGDAARQFLRRNSPALVITELDVEDVDGVQICREAKALASPPPVLITTTDAQRVPDALVAGCDGVLLKPFAPNLLYARIGRLLRSRSQALRSKAEYQRSKAMHLSERSEALLSGSNRVWPHSHCPYCSNAGVTSFEFTSHRRAWYACLECRKVWIAKRQE